MHAQSTPARITNHCFGIIMHHRLAWWLVEFPDLDATPLRARKLSGRLTPALADWLRRETGDARLGDDVAALNPDSRCWSGEFSYVPAAGAADLFDIDAHPWGSEASELETRLARPHAICRPTGRVRPGGTSPAMPSATAAATSLDGSSPPSGSGQPEVGGDVGIRRPRPVPRASLPPAQHLLKPAARRPRRRRGHLPCSPASDRIGFKANVASRHICVLAAA